MSYVGETVGPGEVVAYRTRLHWVTLLAAVPIFGAGIYMIHVDRRMAIVALLAGIVSLAFAYLQLSNTEISVTNRRVVVKRGFIARSTLEMNIDRIESVDVQQGVLGRVLDFGTINIRGTGGGLEPIANVQSPLALRNHLLRVQPTPAPSGYELAARSPL